MAETTNSHSELQSSMDNSIAELKVNNLEPQPTAPPPPIQQDCTDKCNYCSSPRDSLTPPILKRCSACKTTKYCSILCQKADWPKHKTSCTHRPKSKKNKKNKKKTPLANLSRNTSNITSNLPLVPPIPSPFTALRNGSYLLSRPAADIYRILIDSFRLRIEDTYSTGIIPRGSIYDDADDNGTALFKEYLHRAFKKGLLPGWWNASEFRSGSSINACVEMGEKGDYRCRLVVKIWEDDLERWYGGKDVVLQFRLLAEGIYGVGVRGRSWWDEGRGMLDEEIRKGSGRRQEIDDEDDDQAGN